MSRKGLLTFLTLGSIILAPAAYAADLPDVGTDYAEPAAPTIVEESVVERPIVVTRHVEIARPVERQVIVEQPIERRIIVEPPPVERRIVVEHRFAPRPGEVVVERRVRLRRHPIPALPTGTTIIEDRDAD